MVRAPDFPHDALWLFPNSDSQVGQHGEISLEKISLLDLRGQIVVLDFWTYGCINCLHILPELAELEVRYGDRITILGIHSAKFDHETQPSQVQQAMKRHGIRHPVLCDREFQVWQQYAIRAWPTIVVIDPKGYIAGQFVGEGHQARLIQLLDHLLAEKEPDEQVRDDKGVESQELGQQADTQPRPDTLKLSFPGKLCLAQPQGLSEPYLFIADSSHHRIAITTLTGTWMGSIGTGVAGFSNGPSDRAQFRYPQGMVWDDAEQKLYVADAGNHAVRVVSGLFHSQTALQNNPLQTEPINETTDVQTLAGTGEQSRVIHPHGGKGHELALNSPWDLAIVERNLFVAMAGVHQIWRIGLEDDDRSTLSSPSTPSFASKPFPVNCETYAGSGAEGWADGDLLTAAFAQPSGLATDGHELFVADAETSSIRAIGPVSNYPDCNAPEVRTVCGSGMLFGWGDRDGVGEDVRLQHCLGLTYHQGSLWVVDTYNHRIKRVDPQTGECQSRFGAKNSDSRDVSKQQEQFAEPSGIASWGDILWIADTNNHRICSIEAETVQALELRSPDSQHNSSSGFCSPESCT